MFSALHLWGKKGGRHRLGYVHVCMCVWLARTLQHATGMQGMVLSVGQD
jgi:hypothetical protein